MLLPGGEWGGEAKVERDARNSLRCKGSEAGGFWEKLASGPNRSSQDLMGSVGVPGSVPRGSTMPSAGTAQQGHPVTWP